MSEHTPTPWVQFAFDGKCDAIMPAGRDGDICTFRDAPSDADAAFIVNAVNSHDALVKALEDMVNTFQPFTMKPVGAPNSAVRLGQEHQIAIHRAARDILAAVGNAGKP